MYPHGLEAVAPHKTSPPIQAILSPVDNTEAERVLLSVELGHLGVVTHMERQITIQLLADLFLTVSGLCTGETTPRDRTNMDPNSILFDQGDH